MCQTGRWTLASRQWGTASPGDRRPWVAPGKQSLDSYPHDTSWSKWLNERAPSERAWTRVNVVWRKDGPMPNAGSKTAKRQPGLCRPLHRSVYAHRRKRLTVHGKFQLHVNLREAIRRQSWSLGTQRSVTGQDNRGRCSVISLQSPHLNLAPRLSAREIPMSHFITR